jgi:hypothetical protein
MKNITNVRYKTPNVLSFVAIVRESSGFVERTFLAHRAHTKLVILKKEKEYSPKYTDKNV